MRAFVFSGGANRGSLQAGAALALIEAGIIPDLVVGSSVGAINAAVLACHPSLDGIRKTVERWRDVRRETIFPGNSFSSALRVVRGLGSFHPNDALRRFITSLLPPDYHRFEDTKIPLLVTATRFDTGALHVFGTNPQEPLIDALLASSAVTPYLPPYEYDGTLYFDGGFASNLPLSVALQHGATEIWALEIGVNAVPGSASIGIRDSLSRTFETMMRQQMRQEVELIRLMKQSGVTMHHIRMLHYSGLDVRDFRYTEELLALGEESARVYLTEQRELEPTDVPPPQPVPSPLSTMGSKVAEAARQRGHFVQAKADVVRLKLRTTTHQSRQLVQRHAEAMWQYFQRRDTQPVPVEADAALQPPLLGQE